MIRGFRTWVKRDGPRLLRTLGVREGSVCLDLGCGIGGWVAPLARVAGSGGRVTGVDHHPGNLAEADKLCDEVRAPADAPVVFLESDIEHALDRQATGSVDTILLCDVLQHLAGWGRVFADCVRVLRPGGVLVVNPAGLSHPGALDLEILFRFLFEAGLAPGVSRVRARVMHYRRMAEDELWSFTPAQVRVTAFQARVYAACMRIPAGQVATYGGMAAHIGCGSARAVGQALRRNPFAPLVPCHRVVAADGRLGGFGGRVAGPELERKRALLADEGVGVDASGRLENPDVVTTLTVPRPDEA